MGERAWQARRGWQHSMQVRAPGWRVHDDHGPITGRFDPWRMPEGPSRVILREETEAFVGRKILRVSGNSKQNIARLDQQNVLARRRWGKHVLIECAHFSVRIHFLLFGSYRTNEDKPNAVPRLCLEFSNGQRLNFYACSVQFIERTLDDVYDWTAHAMNPLWDAAQARRKRRAVPGMLVADALLDQALFAGVGNIIKNEVSHRIRVHPEEHGRCVACTQTRRTGVPGARRQFRFSSLEKSLRAEEALPGAHQDQLPARWRTVAVSQARGQGGARCVFLRGVPAVVPRRRCLMSAAVPWNSDGDWAGARLLMGLRSVGVARAGAGMRAPAWACISHCKPSAFPDS